MANIKCGYCNKKAGKRYCPSLDKVICSVCCGSNRLKNIACEEECRYLDHEVYQQKIHEEKELRTLLNTVPHSEYNDIFQNPEAASIAYEFEKFWSECYVNGLFNLTDQKVKETLTILYFHIFKGKELQPDDFVSATMKIYDQLIEDGDNVELIGKIMLRLIISIKNMTGGKIGPYGYLNYLKNNMNTDGTSLADGFILETKEGKKKHIPRSEYMNSKF